MRRWKIKSLRIHLSSLGGFCTVDADGCAISPNFPYNYGIKKGCVFQVRVAGSLDFESFELEDSTNCELDYVRFALTGTKYCGTHKPPLLAVFPGETFTFRSDALPQLAGMG